MQTVLRTCSCIQQMKFLEREKMHAATKCDISHIEYKTKSGKLFLLLTAFMSNHDGIGFCFNMNLNIEV